MAKTPLFRWLEKNTRQAVMGEKITRREFLRRSAETAIGLTAAAALGSSFNALAKSRETLFGTLAGSGTSETAIRTLAALKAEQSAKPVIIVGGGLAGLVTAYRLMQAGLPCELYEASPRLGGRVFTHDNFNREGMFCELGGELIDTGHTDIIELCKELSVPLEVFEPGDIDMQPAVYFSGGKIRSEAEVIAAFQPLAQRLIADSRKIFPDGDIQIPTYKNTFNAQWLDQLSLSAYLEGTPRLEDWLRRLIEVAYIGEYGLEATEQSALNLLLLIGTESEQEFRIFGESDEAMRIQGGNSRLVDKLVSKIATQIPIHTQQALVRIRDDGEHIGLTFRHQDSRHTVLAERVVLAIPFTILRSVEGVGQLNLSPVKKRCIRELGYGTNSKQMMGFRGRFWRQLQGELRPNTGAIYTDWASQCYWETSRLQAGQSGILTNFLGGKAGAEARSSQWKNALNDLSRLYPQVADAFDQQTAFFNWSRYPLARGSYSCPKPGQYTTLVGAAGEPELGGRLLFAGEHCSVDWAGFMNGAVQSGNMIAQQCGGSAWRSLQALSPR